MAPPVERRRAVVREPFAREALVDRLRELAGLAEVGRRGLEPEHVGVRGVGQGTGDRGVEPLADAEEALRRPLAGDERGVALVDVARQQRCGERVGAGDEHRRYVEHVGSEPRRDERADELARRHEHLAAEVAALLLRRQLVLVVDGRGAGLDHRLHQLERVQRAAEAGLGVGEDRDEPPRRRVALGPVDLVGAQQRIVDAADERRSGVGRVEALVGVHVPREVGVGGDLPAGDVDRLQAGLHHLHRLAARECAERADESVAAQQLPEPLCAETRERVLDVDGAAQALHVLLRVGPRDAVHPTVHLHAVPPLGSRNRNLGSYFDGVYPDLSRSTAISDPGLPDFGSEVKREGRTELRAAVVDGRDRHGLFEAL